MKRRIFLEKVSCLHDFIFLDAVFMWTVILENGSEKGSEMGAKHRKYPGFSGGTKTACRI